MSLFWLLFFLILALPGIYLASKKNFLIISDQKYNIFPVRLIFTVLGSLLFILPPALLLFIILTAFLYDFSQSLVSTWGQYAILIFPLLCSLLTIAFFKVYVLRKGMPPEFSQDSDEGELYLYKPLTRIPGGFDCGTNIVWPKNMKHGEEILVGTQMENLRLNFQSLRDKEIALTKWGELIASTKAIEIFNQNNITGFDLRPIQDYKMRSHLLESEYFQLVSTNVFPPLSPKTKLVKKMPFHFTDFRVYVKDGLFYYSKKSLNNVLDFNTSFEVFGSSSGSSGQPQKLWIVTNKTRKILINDLNQHKRDFVPVILVDEQDK